MKISVCMATYNGERFLREQLDSILKQLSANDEVVVSDDGSTDGTLDIIESYEDSRIILLHSTQKNLIFNFENALKRATGDVVFLSDQDDIWFPAKVEICLKHLRKNDLVFSNLEVFSADPADSRTFYGKQGKKTGIFRNLIKNNYVGATMAFNRRVLNRALPFPKDIYMHDIWLAVTAEIIGKTFYIENPLIYYRRHDTNFSRTGEKSSNSFFEKLRMRFVLVCNLYKRFL